MRYHALYMETHRGNDFNGNDKEDGGGGEVYMDPVVYWTSLKEGLGMEELLLSVGNSVAEDGYCDDDATDEYEERDEHFESDNSSQHRSP